jgi:hypothetical protein
MRVQARRMGIEASQNAGELRPTQPSKWSPSLKLPAISDRYAGTAIATAAESAAGQSCLNQIAVGQTGWPKCGRASLTARV